MKKAWAPLTTAERCALGFFLAPWKAVQEDMREALRYIPRKSIVCHSFLGEYIFKFAFKFGSDEIICVDHWKQDEKEKEVLRFHV